MIDHKTKYKERVFERLTDRSAAKVQPTMIKIDGKMFFTSKGKNLWKTPGHAKLALRNDIQNYIYCSRWIAREDRMSFEEEKQLSDEIMSGAEFVSVEVSNDMLGNLKF